MASKDGTAPGAVRLHLADGVPLLLPEEQVFTGRMILYHLGELTLRIGTVTDPGDHSRSP
ncbi:hypothetical protein AB0N06_34330 [Streptomyces sp. NPDC051020]|uniref:hypothetical protein n=1 Tax=Streptomyces sp. NPDC051020 TaxID=3155409 RepID=UPI00341E47AF